MEIKYEAVFGDQSLFNGMMPDCEFVDGTYGYKRVGDKFYYCERYNEKAGWSPSRKSHLTFNPSAMRRVICTPTWSVADQKAGKLPEVGAFYDAEGCRVKHLGVGAAGYEDIFHFEYPSGACGCSNKIFIKPIETPEEMAARLREEWAELAINDAYSSIGLRDREKPEHIMRYFRRVYEAMLSGDLPMPVKE